MLGYSLLFVISRCHTQIIPWRLFLYICPITSRKQEANCPTTSAQPDGTKQLWGVLGKYFSTSMLISQPQPQCAVTLQSGNGCRLTQIYTSTYHAGTHLKGKVHSPALSSTMPRGGPPAALWGKHSAKGGLTVAITRISNGRLCC